MENKNIFKFFLVPVLCIFVLFLISGIGILVYRSSFEDEETGTSQSESLSPQNTSLLTEDLSSRIDSYSLESSSEASARDIIRNGYISVAVEDLDETFNYVNGLSSEYKFSLTNVLDQGKGIDRAISLTIKVNEEKFENLYALLKDLDGEYVSSSISESDVTDVVVDLEARLENYRSVEEQYLKILESAKTVEETLSVHKELGEVRYNIERIESELKNMENQTDYSYIYVTLSQSSSGAELEDSEWKPLGILNDALRSLVSFAKFLGSTLIWLLVFSPVLALIFVPVWLVRRKKK